MWPPEACRPGRGPMVPDGHRRDRTAHERHDRRRDSGLGGGSGPRSYVDRRSAANVGNCGRGRHRGRLSAVDRGHPAREARAPATSCRRGEGGCAASGQNGEPARSLPWSPPCDLIARGARARRSRHRRAPIHLLRCQALGCLRADECSSVALASRSDARTPDHRHAHRSDPRMLDVDRPGLRTTSRRAWRRLSADGRAVSRSAPLQRPSTALDRRAGGRALRDSPASPWPSPPPPSSPGTSTPQAPNTSNADPASGGAERHAGGKRPSSQVHAAAAAGTLWMSRWPHAASASPVRMTMSRMAMPLRCSASTGAH